MKVRDLLKLYPCDQMFKIYYTKDNTNECLTINDCDIYGKIILNLYEFIESNSFLLDYTIKSISNSTISIRYSDSIETCVKLFVEKETEI